MRKSAEDAHQRSAATVRLQCGRIYKDAEIFSAACFGLTEQMLQCGRIYKDAEIGWKAHRASGLQMLQCGRIYKDAEMVDFSFLFHLSFPRFNVAASIKMRKCCE